MKNACLSLFVVALLSLNFCSGAGKSVSYDGCPRPAWVDNPPVEGGLAHIGVARGISTSSGRKLAEDNGRHGIAQQMSVKVMGLIEQSFQSVAGKSPEEMAGHEYGEGVQRTLYKQFISGVRPFKYYFDCVKDEYYALMVMDYQALAAAAKQQADKAAKELLQTAKEKHEELSKKMDELLDKEFPDKNPNF
ncbi:MAG: hypothetical protein FJ088_02045 [Deltaproteobacteria bacterium]|nr:hypothetical protein [Deltaproteobacteria bacterium]